MGKLSNRQRRIIGHSSQLPPVQSLGSQQQIFCKVAATIVSRPDLIGRPMIFLRKIIPTIHGCWHWVGSKRVNANFPVHKYGSYCSKLPHRLMWAAINGPIPADKEIDHICHNKLCVNPDHLQLLTHFENCQRRPRVGRIPKRLGGR